MKLKSLVIDNFKVIDHFEFTPNGQSTDIFGANRRGKTTTYDALLWQLFGKDSKGQSIFGIKPIRNGQEVHGRDTVVEADYLMEDGSTMSLRKLYKEVVNKKGKLTGHTTEYWFDGKYHEKEKDYQAAIDKVANEQQFKLLTRPLYFNEVLPWKDRRSILLQMTGVDASEIDQQEARKTTLKKQVSDLREKKAGIMDNIKGAEKVLPPMPDKAPCNIVELRSKLKALQEKRAQLSTNSAIADINIKVAEVEAALKTCENQQTEKIQAQRLEAQKQERLLRAEISDIEGQISLKRRSASLNLVGQSNLASSMASINSKGKELKQKSYTGSSECPTCKRPLPEDQLEEAMAAFNLNKSQELESLRNRWHELEEENKLLKSAAEINNQEINYLSNKLPELQEKGAARQTEIEFLRSLLNDVKSLPEYQEILQKRDALISKRMLLQKGNPVSTIDIDREIADIQIEIDRSEKAEVIITQRQAGLKTIEEYDKTDKKLAQEIEAKDLELSRIEDALANKLGALEGKINGMFKSLNFKVFKKHINGILEQCCDCTMKTGVEYKDFSYSETLYAGLEIIKVLAAFYKLSCPVFIDQRREITELPDMGGIQIISLYVSPVDLALRVEPANKKWEMLI